MFFLQSRKFNKVKEKKTSSQVWLILAFACFLIYIFVRGSTGSYYIPLNTVNPRYEIGGSTIATLILYIGLLISILIGLKEMQNYSTKRYILVMFAMYIPITIWLLNDIINNSIFKIFGITTLNPFCFLMFFSVYAGMNDKIWNSTVRICNKISPLLICLSLGYTIYFLVEYGAVSITNSPQIIYLSMGFWPLTIRALCNLNTKRNIITEILIAISLFCALMYNSRGWIFQCLLLMFFYAYIHESKLLSFKGLLTVICIIFLIIISYYIAIRFMPLRIESLLNKFSTGTQSRVWQYEEVLSQYSKADFIFGKGSFATYDTDLYGSFMYFDNSFMNLIMKYGIIPTIAFLYVILRPIIKLLALKITRKEKAIAYILILFFLAIIGLSVYCVVTVDLKFLIICILIGRSESIINKGRRKV